jgi:murein DD-endopeptidase MepM/ murein hydrolase activator NlpD
MRTDENKIITTLNIILENKNILLTEAPSNTNHLFNNNRFRWGGGPSAHRTRALGNWQSDNAWDIMAPAGTPIYAIEGGTISRLSGSLKLKKTVYGYNITIKGKDNDFFYTHLGSRNPDLTIGSQVEKGDFLGTIGTPAENPSWPQHVHIGLRTGDIKKYMDKQGNILDHNESDLDDSPQETEDDNTETTKNLMNTLKDKFSLLDDSSSPELMKKIADYLKKFIKLDESLNREKPNIKSVKKLNENIDRIKKLL